jgi:iron complex outermembrane receptor protein
MYGGISLYEPLRQVPGVNVMTSTVAQPDIAIRGLNELISNQTLLLVDGRNQYLPAQGFFMWSTITIQPDEVKQIEIVKGPVASLYGANAFNGLINIITKTPEELNGTYFTEKTNFDDVYTISSLVHGQRINDLGYKLSLGWDRYEYFYHPESYKTNLLRGNAQVDYHIDDESAVSLSAGGSYGEHPFITSNLPIYLGENDIGYFYTMLDGNLGDFEGKVFWNHFIANYDPDTRRFKSKVDTIETELTYKFEPIEKHDVTVGTGLRYDYAYGNIFGPQVSPKCQLIYNAYIQDDWEVTDRIRFIGSGRLDQYAISGLQLSGRVAGLFKIFEDNFIRASLGNSYRAPTLSEYYLDIYQRTTPMAHNFGQENLDVEKIVTGEVGYEGKFFDKKLKFNSDFFVSYIKNFIESTRTGFESLFPTVIITSGYLNQGNATTWGVENSLEYKATDWMKCFVNNTHQLVSYENDAFIRVTPKNMWNMGVLVDYNDKLEASLYWHYVDKAENSGNTKSLVSKYSTINGRLGYWVTENIEVAVSGTNLFLDKHEELPGVDTGEQIGRRILAEVRLKF